MTPEQKDKLRALPAIGQLLERKAVRQWLDRFPRTLVVDALQAAVDEMRKLLLEGSADESAVGEGVLAYAERVIEARSKPSLRPVINATGVVLHTGLGRAPLCEEAVRTVARCAGGYNNLETDLESGGRGQRQDHVAALLRELTGAEAATVVNNNAAATLLLLNSVAQGSEVIVSRGQLVEIGGSYRLPEVMSASGAILREVGTTNRTRIGDYEKAISDNTAALMHVHTSNFKVVGFTESASIEELTALGRRMHKLVIDDLGSGAIFDLGEVGLPREPHARASLDAGADLVCFSGDKLLGGPQAGVILGRRDLVSRIQSTPLMRTYRVGKMTLAALEATLRQYRDHDHAARTIPSLALLACAPAALHKRAQKLCRQLRCRLEDETFEVIKDRSVAGGGSLPTAEMETRCVSWAPSSMSVDEALKRLRTAETPIIARASRDRVLLDVRTVTEDELAPLADALVSCASNP